jgi:hypothetical protein
VCLKLINMLQLTCDIRVLILEVPEADSTCKTQSFRCLVTQEIYVIR